MLAREADFLGEAIRRYFPPGCSIAHVGSSTLDFRRRIQPHIGRNIDDVCAHAGIKLINVDIKQAEGVDLVGDLTEARFLKTLTELSLQGVIVANLFEHLSNKQPLAAALGALIDKDKYLLISGPMEFPFHPDPIDNLYRPSPRDLLQLFPGFVLISSQVIDCGDLREFLGGGKGYRFWRARSAIKSLHLLLSLRFRQWHRLNTRRMSAFLVVLKKGREEDGA